MEAPLSIHGFPRAILHIDGDAFFASCEQSRNPNLKGKPVITGKERGIVASMSYEAKARGVTRAMRLSEVKRVCPEAVLLPSDYETYSLLSQRLFAIVRRYTPDVEEYSIDECFADLTGLRRVLRLNYTDIARKIKHDLDTELGFTFSAGLAHPGVIGDVWQVIDIHVHGTLWDSLPNSILEGMSLGKPLVATTVGGIPEAVHHAKTGLLVPPGESAALASALLQLLENTDYAAHLGRAAFSLYRREYTQEIMTRRLELLFMELTEARTGPRLCTP